MELILKTTLVGIGATIFMDLYALTLRNLFKIPSLNYALLGRWLGHIPKGKFYHLNIITSTPINKELALGWIAHYGIGIGFAFILRQTYGEAWLSNPTILPAIIIGLTTIIAPFFIMQPAFGFGIAGSKLPQPNLVRLKSLLTHLIYGLGLYATAKLIWLLTL
ncbi:DUF2938 domain-containing protein [Zhouia amylolytica]|uniref:DUF2938 domain-containing protein n=1 Tax=Zhouia amylolytica TaxID=376730 RepID=UPI0020CD18C3|nr:DUF2938 domain-containing protein [Zhouia amylolytica]MCQ0111521.1 DUF2938 domain-containing protein [Zhouia amylolytica]